MPCSAQKGSGRHVEGTFKGRLGTCWHSSQAFMIRITYASISCFFACGGSINKVVLPGELQRDVIFAEWRTTYVVSGHTKGGCEWEKQSTPHKKQNDYASSALLAEPTTNRCGHLFARGVSPLLTGRQRSRIPYILLAPLHSARCPMLLPCLILILSSIKPGTYVLAHF